MKASVAVSSLLLAGALVALPTQTALADPAPSSGPHAALATDSDERVAVAITGGRIENIDGAMVVVDKHGTQTSTLPSTIVDDQGRVAQVHYQLVGDTKAVITATIVNYIDCVISGAVKNAVRAAVDGGVAGGVAGGLAGAAAGGLIGGGLTIWSGPGAVIGAAVAAIPGILTGAATGAASGAAVGATTTILTDGVKSLFSCAPVLTQP